MKYTTYVTALFYLLLVQLGCQTNTNCAKKNRDIMGEYYNRKIIFPDNLIALNAANSSNGNIYKQIILKNKGFYVVHFFTADCDECINELKKIQKFIQRTKLENTRYIFIASGPTKIFVLNAIKKVNFKYDVYFEKEYYSFKNINHFTLSDRVFDTMLINDKAGLLLAGALFDDDFTKDLYVETINCRQ